MKMLEERFLELMEIDSSDDTWDGDNVLIGLNLIAKYFDKNTTILKSSDYETIYSVSVKDLINSGITEEDTEKLRKLNWMIQDDYLACFV